MKFVGVLLRFEFLTQNINSTVIYLVKIESELKLPFWFKSGLDIFLNPSMGETIFLYYIKGKIFVKN